MQNKLIELNNEILKRKLSQEDYKKHMLIKKMLEDNMCFFKMEITTAYRILKDLNIKDEKLEEVYKELIDYKNIKSNN